MYVRAEGRESFDKYEEPRLHMETLLNTNLVNFDLPLRILIPLERHGIRTLGDLVTRKRSDITSISNIGVTAMKKIDDFVAHHLLTFGMKV